MCNMKVISHTYSFHIVFFSLHLFLNWHIEYLFTLQFDFSRETMVKKKICKINDRSSVRERKKKDFFKEEIH